VVRPETTAAGSDRPRASSVQHTSGIGRGSQRRRASRSESLRAMLASPHALRQALLLREILGPPVALRVDVRDRPD
jgi:hypothetical protein